jgi:hypothetical protein
MAGFLNGRAGVLLLLFCGFLLAACSPPVQELPTLASTLPPLPAFESPVPSPTPSDTPTPLPPTATNTPVPTPTFATLTPSPVPVTETPLPIIINEVSMREVTGLSPQVRENIDRIYKEGQALGRDPGAFSRLGASIVATNHFLGRFDTGPYDLGPYSHLEPAVEQFQGSFSRIGVAALKGLTAVASFDPLWAIDEDCQSKEIVIDCEIRLHNPSIIFIVLGTNDKWDANQFDEFLRLLVDYTISQGVIPVLATKADRFEGEDNRNNEIIRQIAKEFKIPLWDFDLLAESLPDRGMAGDNVHLTLFDYYDYNMDLAYETGYGLYNLTALMMLDEIWREVAEPGP